MMRPLALAVCAVSFVVASGAAYAKPKVALTQIEGDASGDVREAVVEALEGGKEVSLISGREVNRAVDKIGDVADLTEKDFKKLSTQLSADAIVLGKLEKAGKAKTLKFRIYLHKKMAKGFTVSFKDASSPKFKAVLHDKLVDKLGAASGGGGDEAEDDKPAKKAPDDDAEDPLARPGKKAGKNAKKAKLTDEDAEAKPAKKAHAEDEDAEAKPAKKAKLTDEDEDARPAKKQADDEAEAEHGEGEAAKKSDDEDAPRRGKKKVAAAEDGEELEATASASAEPAGPRSANHAALRVEVGASMVQRSYSFNSTLANTPKNVSLSPVPGARVAGEIYPLALSGSRGALAGLGIAGLYDRTIKLDVSTMGQSAPVKQSHWEVGLRYRLAFGQTEKSPTLTLGVGYGKRLFSPQRGDLMGDAAAELLADTPTTEYTVIDPGLAFRLPITRSVAFVAGGRGMLITKAGPIQNANSYGRAKVYGVDADAGVDIVLGKRFAIHLAAEFAQIGFTFTGDGDLSKNLDGDASQQDVGGLADRSLGGSATLAILY
jgi:hypothetical protein